MASDPPSVQQEWLKKDDQYRKKGKRNATIGYRLLAQLAMVDCLLSIGYWLLAIGYWLTGYWLLAIGYRIFG